jgi:hypothetical protein
MRSATRVAFKFIVAFDEPPPQGNVLLLPVL